MRDQKFERIPGIGPCRFIGGLVGGVGAVTGLGGEDVLDTAGSFLGIGGGPDQGTEEAAAATQGAQSVTADRAQRLISEFGRDTVRQMAEIGSGSIHKWCDGGRCSGSFGDFEGFSFSKFRDDLSRHGLSESTMRRAGQTLEVPVGQDAIGEGVFRVGQAAARALESVPATSGSANGAGNGNGNGGSGGGAMAILQNPIVLAAGAFLLARSL